MNTVGKGTKRQSSLLRSGLEKQSSSLACAGSLLYVPVLFCEKWKQVFGPEQPSVHQIFRFIVIKQPTEMCQAT